MSAAEGGDDRLRAAGAVLAAHGLGGARVEVLGEEQEMAVLCLSEPALAALPALAPPRVPELVRALRALGFRYVTLDLDPFR